MSVSGVINLYKPAGRLSAKFCYQLRPILGERRIGHAGTLDPFADGVLVVCVGKATRLVFTEQGAYFEDGEAANASREEGTIGLLKQLEASL